MTKQNTPASILAGQWEVIDGMARPKNEHPQRLYMGYGDISEGWKDFEQFASQHSYPAPVLKDGVYEAEKLQFVWQYKSQLGEWINAPSCRYDEFEAFEDYEADSKAYGNGIDTRLAITATPTEVKEPKALYCICISTDGIKHLTLGKQYIYIKADSGHCTITKDNNTGHGFCKDSFAAYFKPVELAIEVKEPEVTPEQNEAVEIRVDLGFGIAAHIDKSDNSISFSKYNIKHYMSYMEFSDIEKIYKSLNHEK